MSYSDEDTTEAKIAFRKAKIKAKANAGKTTGKSSFDASDGHETVHEKKKSGWDLTDLAPSREWHRD